MLTATHDMCSTAIDKEIKTRKKTKKSSLQATCFQLCFIVPAQRKQALESGLENSLVLNTNASSKLELVNFTRVGAAHEGVDESAAGHVVDRAVRTTAACCTCTRGRLVDVTFPSDVRYVSLKQGKKAIL